MTKGDIMINRLPVPIINLKLIPRNFGSIPHLPGSRMKDADDVSLDINQVDSFIRKTREPYHKIRIMEKIDGSNSGVLKRNGLLYPINRKGYDVRSIPSNILAHKVMYTWAKWVNEHYDLYDSLLDEGERLVFENCIVQHTLRYRFGKQEPVFLLAKYDKNNQRIPFDDYINIAKQNNIRTPHLFTTGCALPPDVILQNHGSMVGGRDGIEGLVYYYEENGAITGLAKYVSNDLIIKETSLSQHLNQFKNKELYTWNSDDAKLLGFDVIITDENN
jgi:hypothetical protein